MVKKGPWSKEEDLILINFVKKHGPAKWRTIPKQAGLLRCGKSCRLRWLNYLRPDLKRGNFTKGEEEALIKLQQQYGNKWSKIASHFPGRTDNEIKNVWNWNLRKRLDKKEGNHPKNKIKENPTSNSSSCINFTNFDNEQMENKDFMNNGEYEENYEVFSDFNLDNIEVYNEETDFEFWKKWEREDHSILPVTGKEDNEGKMGAS